MVGAVYDRGYRGYEGDARRPDARPAPRCSARRSGGPSGIRRPWRQKVAPAVLLGIATVPGHRVRRRRLRHPRHRRVRLRVDHLPRVRRRLEHLLVFVALTAPDIMCPDRRQRVLPLVFARPLTGRRLRARQGRRHVRHPVRVLVPAAGGAVRRPDARERRRRAPLRPRQRRGALAGARRGRACCRSTTRRSAWRSRRSPRGASSPAPRSSALLLVSVDRERGPRRAGGERPSERAARPVRRRPSITEDGEVIVVPVRRRGRVRRRVDVIVATRPVAGALVNLLTLPLVVRDLVFLGEVEAGHPLSGLANGGLYALLVYGGVADRRVRDPLLALRRGRAMTDSRRCRSAAAPAAAGARPRVRGRRHRGGQRRVGVVRAEGGAVGAELLLRRRRHRPARPERRRQDHADARHHRPDPGQPGQRRRRRPVAARRPLGVRAPRPRPRGRGGARAACRPASSAPTWPTCTASPTAGSSTGRSTPCEMQPAADRSMDGFSKGMRQRSKVAAALVKNPLVLVLDEPLNGADPVQRAAPHRPVPAARRRGPHGDRQLARAARGRGDGRAGDRDRARPAGGRRRAPRHPRRDGRRAAPAARARARRSRASPPRSSATRRSSGVRVDGDDLIVSTTRAKDVAVLLPRAARDLGVHLVEVRPARRLAREPVPGAGAVNAIATRPSAAARAPRHRRATRCARRCPAKRWIGALVPAATSILFGLLATTLDDTAGGRVRRRGRQRAVHPRAARSPAW